MQQLQAAAAQWQQHPHHRVGFQYQRIMQKHAQLQQIVQQYQQIMQQPPHLEVRHNKELVFDIHPESPSTHSLLKNM